MRLVISLILMTHPFVCANTILWYSTRRILREQEKDHTFAKSMAYFRMIGRKN
nr:MAG TPA: hypothetical protein [Caudoviricetes sp.]